MDTEIENKSSESSFSGFKRNEVPKEKLWNLNFILLFQGQAVSILGDNVFDIALRFWILSKTGSVSLMGVLLAVATLPKVFISPFAGTFVDRHDRKKVLITADIIRAIAIFCIGIAAVAGFLQVWMVFISCIVVDICGCFFNPTINSCIPDVVPQSKLLKANSILSSISSVNDMVGYAFGGFLVQIIGAPVLFVINGFSFLFSAVSECFTKIPQIKSSSEKLNFMEDMKAGIP
ncbi:putative bacilysin exporter BacE [Oxobacter pfennigii]|uniref:Putative bacilysin exporter BacE n=1 Tax=Oxobacter pfennigii TaxID=36849 RepID=A0A0P8W3X9_9CLOT|nr:MFS transporter [Oxobacter pfennigii]KPU43284.1 putative bacilysin exporter BacE [Oxobacter pfennigii]